MDNIIIDQRIKIQQLEEENKALKSKINLMYENWSDQTVVRSTSPERDKQYDYRRFLELKQSILGNSNP